MKRILNLIIGLAFVISCHAQQEKLELNLVKGETYFQNMSSNTSIIQTIFGQEVDMDMSLDSKVSYKVTGIQNNIYDMEVMYESMTMKMNLPNGIMEFSSEKIDENDILSTLLGSMIQKPFSIKMTKTGIVNEVKNIDSLFSNMFDLFPQVSDIQKQQIKGQITQAYGEKAFKGNIEMFSAIFSDSPVSKGDKWTVNTQLEAGMSAKVKTIYELKDISDSYYQIFGNAIIETADKDAYIETNGMPLKYDLAGTMTSDIKIDKSTGWAISAKVNQTIKGTAYIKDNPQIPGGLAIPMTINSESTISE